MIARFSIDRFLNIRSATGPSFSPDGRFVSFLYAATGVAQVWQVPVEGGWPVQLTFGADTVRGAAYSPTRPEILFGMDAGGNERVQGYLLTGSGDHGLGDGWTTEAVTRHPDAIHRFGGWSPDGDAFAFSANRDAPARFDLYVQKRGDRDAKLVAKGPGGYFEVAGFSPDGRTLLVHRTESNANHDLYLIEVATGKRRHLTPHRGEVQYEAPHFSAGGKAVYCLSTADGRDRTHIARIDLETGKVEFTEGSATERKHESDRLLPSPKGRWLASTVNVEGRSELILRDLKNSARHTPDLPLGVVSELAFAPDDSKLAFVLSGPRHNPDAWVWDLVVKGQDRPAKEPRRLTRASRGGIPFEKFKEPELVHYPTFDDRKVPAWFYPPEEAPGDRLPPAIVYPHGGPESQYRPVFNPLFQYFAQAGYAVLAPNVRGSTGYGTAYMNLDNTTRRMDSVKDLAHAAHWLRDQKKADPKRLAVYGGSYGGFMVLAQVTHFPELWAAGIDVVGIANFVTFLERTGAYRRAHREAEYGNLRDHKEFLEKISPINHVDRIKCPMMVIHGANDPRVPIGEAEQIVAALKKRRVPVEYLRYEDEGHGLGKLKNRLDCYPKMVAFLDRHLR